MAAITEVVDFVVLDGVGVVTVDNPPRHALDPLVRDGLDGAVKAALADPDVRAVVIACDGEGFVTGDELDDPTGPPLGTPLTALQTRIEQADRPVIAALSGTVAGEGLELALCCHLRIAAPDTRLRFTEVARGIVPGAGGTQRLPRLVGPECALSMLLWGQALSAAEAQAAGLVDAVAAGELLPAAIASARAAAGGQRPRCTADRDPCGGLTVPERRALWEATEQALRERNADGPAPRAALQCVQAACDDDLQEGLRFEAQQLLQLLMLR